ncbi:hypothetical protein KJ570_00595 [Patescibacteria group bacterium]|nr:hypothetical protein [Patescibacteria group bacterium]MBU2035858.1 hypothetical protein [Patescibacteria group bacterium]
MNKKEKSLEEEKEESIEKDRMDRIHEATLNTDYKDPGGILLRLARNSWAGNVLYIKYLIGEIFSLKGEKAKLEKELGGSPQKESSPAIEE